MKLIKMDRRFDMQRLGFTHQIRNMTINEKNELCKFFNTRYGPSREHVLVEGKYVERLNNNWRWVQQKRRFTGGSKIYIKHPQDLTLLGLKFSELLG